MHCGTTDRNSLHLRIVASMTHARRDSYCQLLQVSPTVNINLDGRRDSSTSVHASQLPANQIRAFVEQNVLPKFTRILLQPGTTSDNTTADVCGTGSSKSGSSKHKIAASASYKQQQQQQLDPVSISVINSSGISSSKVLSSSSKQQQGPEFDAWLRTLLHDMQKSIETHIAMVFEARTAVAVAVRS
jgi:hypothetical protein